MPSFKVRTGPHKPYNLSPDLAAFPDVWGVFVGDGCVTGAEPLEWLKIHAHAHDDIKDEWFGWICIADARNVITAKGHPTAILLHEIAHIICRGAGHNKKWQTVVTALGAPKEAQKYERKPNGKREQG